MSPKIKKIIDCVEWVIIISLVILCVYVYKNGESAVQEEKIAKQEETYIKIYDSQKMEALKQENAELYEKIEDMSNVESAIEIRYRYVYKTDTVYVENNDDTLKTETPKDSLYHYTYNNDTIKYDLDIKARGLRWHKTDFELNDKFTIVNKEKDGENQLIISHSPNAEITGTDTWHRKENSFLDHIFYGPSVGFGYGMYNRNFDIYVGFTVGYQF